MLLLLSYCGACTPLYLGLPCVVSPFLLDVMGQVWHLLELGVLWGPALAAREKGLLLLSPRTFLLVQQLPCPLAASQIAQLSHGGAKVHRLLLCRNSGIVNKTPH